MHKFSFVLAVAALGATAATIAPRAWPQTLLRTTLEKSGKMPRLSACPAKFDDGLDKDGVVPMGIIPGVTPPKAVWTQQAAFTDKARKEIHKRAMFPYESLSTITMVVDPQGLPRDLCVQHSAEFDLDKAAAESVWQYRFQPAMKDGRAVAKRLAVEVRFAMK